MPERATSFSLEDIDRAHQGVTQETVRQYLAELRQLGVVSHTTFISDGHSEYVDAEGSSLSSNPVHEPYEVSFEADVDAFQQALQAHTRKETDYFTFARQLGAAGVATWVMDSVAMSCTFYSQSGKPLLTEEV